MCGTPSSLRALFAGEPGKIARDHPIAVEAHRVRGVVVQRGEFAVAIPEADRLEHGIDRALGHLTEGVILRRAVADKGHAAIRAHEPAHPAQRAPCRIGWRKDHGRRACSRAHVDAEWRNQALERVARGGGISATFEPITHLSSGRRRSSRSPQRADSWARMAAWPLSATARRE